MSVGEGRLSSRTAARVPPPASSRRATARAWHRTWLPGASPAKPSSRGAAPRALPRRRRGPRRPFPDAPLPHPSSTPRYRRRSRRCPAASRGGRSPAETTRRAAATRAFRRPRRPSRATARPANRGSGSAPSSSVLDVLVAEASLDAEVAARDVVVVGRADLDDLVVLDVQRQVAADAAVRADRVDLRLARLVPRAVPAHLELADRHQRAGGADGDAVAAVDARRLRERDVELGGDVRGEATPGHSDGEGVLVVVAAGLDALVTEDALRVVAHVELVVDLHGLRDRQGVGAEAVRLRVVLLDVAQRVGSGGEVDRRPEQLEHEAPARLHPRRVGVHDHAGLDLARAGGNERPGAFDLDDADAAHVHRRERVAVTERRRLDLEPAARVEDRRALGDADLPAVDGQLDDPLDGVDADDGHGASTPRFIMADWTALAAVWPRPQIDASRITCASSASTSSSLPFVLPDASRCSASSWRTVPTRQGTHWPHDSSRKNSAIRNTASTRSALSSYTITTPEPLSLI